MPNNQLAKRIMKLISEGKIAIDTALNKKEELYKKIVILAGVTSTGKSALTNYINDVQLEGVYDENSQTYKLRAKNPDAELPNIKIGSQAAVTSCTRHPGMYSPKGKLYSYVDMPGFDDSGDKVKNGQVESESVKKMRVAQDVANAYFRKIVADKAKELKIVLVVSHDDLNSPKGTLPESLLNLANFISNIEKGSPAILEKIKSAISIVVTKVNNSAAEKIASLEKEIITLKQQINILKTNNIDANLFEKTLQDKEKELTVLNTHGGASAGEKAVELSLKNFVDNAPSLDGIKNMKEILNNIIVQKRFAIFSSPTKPGDITFEEAEKIKDLIENKTNFMSIDEAKIAIKVSDKNSGELKSAIEDLKIVAKKLTTAIDNNIAQRLKAAYEKGQNGLDAIKNIADGCNAIKVLTTPRPLANFFADMYKLIKFSDATIEECDEFSALLKFFVGLLPEADQKTYSDTKNWIKELELGPIFDRHIATANNILNPPQATFDNGKLVIQGFHIKTSQVDEEIRKRSGIKEIEVKALHTLTIDNDLSDKSGKCQGKLQGVNLSLIAPNVVISGDRTIDLSGVNGAAKSKANNGANGGDGAAVGEATAGNNGASGGNGATGAPGDPGNSAGNFLLICDKCPDISHLSVNLNGGNGGPGQEGGNGGKGGDGSGVNMKMDIQFNLFGTLPNFTPENYPACVSRSGFVPTGNVSNHGGNKIDTELRLAGGNGGIGGNGGQGGKGGEAGKKGQSQIIVASNVVNIGAKLQTNDGQPGANGAAGQAGAGGANGRNAEGVWHTRPGQSQWNGHAVHLPKYIGRGSAANGTTPGTTNSSGLVVPVSTTTQNFNCALLNYRIFLELTALQYIDVVCDYLCQFEQNLETLSPTALQTTTKNLLEEAKEIEKYSLVHNSKIDFAPYYYALLEKIKTFALTSTKTPQEMKVLEYLYAAILGSVARVNSAADNLLVIDILGYLRNLINGDFAKLHTLKVDELKLHYRQQYQDQIEGKIEEAKSFLDILRKDIISRQDAIKPKIVQLEGDIKTAIANGGQQLTTLVEQRRKLEEELQKKMILGIFNVVIQGIGMIFPPAGPIVAGVVNAGLNLAMNPSLESAMSFATQFIELKDKLGAIPATTTLKKHEADLFKKLQEMGKTIAPLIQDVRHLLAQRNNGNQQLQQLDAQIQNVTAYVVQLDKYLNTVPAALGNYLEGMVNEVSDFQSALNDKSLAALDFSKLEIKRFFENFKQNIKNLVGSVASSDGFVDIGNKLAEAMEVSVNICTRIQDYRDHIAFANFIAHLHTANVQNLNVGPEYQADVNELRARLQESIVQEAYLRALAAVKQWAFPFADKFLSAIPNLQALDFNSMAHNLPLILRAVENYKTNITTMDQAIMPSSFNGTSPAIPFFTWSYSEHPEKIQALLRGEKVILSTELDKAPLDAVKFQKIGLKVESQLASEQAEINKILADSFKVSLQHSGTSYYKYLGNCYQIASDKPIEISYSFQVKPDGVPQIRNGVWDKMASGDILLSPDTTWMINIEQLPTVPGKVNLLDKLGPMKNHLKLSLVGEGCYVDTTKINSDLHMQQYYHQVKNDYGPEEIESGNTAISSAETAGLLRNGIFSHSRYITTIKKKEEAHAHTNGGAKSKNKFTH